MLSLQAARANMMRTGWASNTTSDGKCKQWGSASHNDKIKFVGPGKPYPGLVRVRFFPYHYTITENQPVLEECVTQGHDKTELTFHVGRKNSKPPLEDFMAGIGSDYVADTELSSHDTPTELNFAFEGVLSFEFEDYTTHSVTIRIGQYGRSTTSPVEHFNYWILGGPECFLRSHPTFKNVEGKVTPCVLKCGRHFLFDISWNRGGFYPAPNHIIVRNHQQIFDPCKYDSS